MAVYMNGMRLKKCRLRPSWSENSSHGRRWARKQVGKWTAPLYDVYASYGGLPVRGQKVITNAGGQGNGLWVTNAHDSKVPAGWDFNTASMAEIEALFKQF